MSAERELLKKATQIIETLGPDDEAYEFINEVGELLEVEEYTIEARLDAAKIIIEMRDKYIAELTRQLDDERSNRAWAADQDGFKRMGL